MNKEKAKKFMDNLVEVNKIIEESNKSIQGECYAYVGRIIVNGLEKISDELQLTRKYIPIEDGTIIEVLFGGFRFRDVLYN